jgi:hypothetical protein
MALNLAQFRVLLRLKRNERGSQLDRLDDQRCWSYLILEVFNVCFNNFYLRCVNLANFLLFQVKIAIQNIVQLRDIDRVLQSCLGFFFCFELGADL